MKPSDFSPELESIVTYAKAINFSFETGTMEDLMRGWLNRGLKINQDIEDNKEDVLKIVKAIIRF